MKNLYFRPNDHGSFLLWANLPFLVGGFLRSKLEKYCSYLHYLIGEGCNIIVVFILVIKF